MIGSRRRIGGFLGGNGVNKVLADDVPDPRSTHWPPLRRDSLQAELGIGVDQSYSPTRRALGPGVLVREMAGWQEGSVGAVCPGRAPLQPQTDAV